MHDNQIVGCCCCLCCIYVRRPICTRRLQVVKVAIDDQTIVPSIPVAISACDLEVTTATARVCIYQHTAAVLHIAGFNCPFVSHNNIHAQRHTRTQTYIRQCILWFTASTINPPPPSFFYSYKLIMRLIFGIFKYIPALRKWYSRWEHADFFYGSVPCRYIGGVCHVFYFSNEPLLFFDIKRFDKRFCSSVVKVYSDVIYCNAMLLLEPSG